MPIAIRVVDQISQQSDVTLTSLANNDVLVYNSSTLKWENKTPTSYLTILLPTQTGNSGKFLTTDGSNVSWTTVSSVGTVTDVSVVTANGVSGSVATSTTTPAITLTLGAITPSTVNGLILTSAATGFTVAGGTTSKTLTVSNTLTLAGTDSSTLNIGSGGTLGSAAFTASSAYEVPLTFSTGLTRSTNTITVNTTQNIAKLSNLTSNGFVKTSAGDGTLSVDTNTYLTGNQTITLSGDVSGSGATAITATIGTNAVTFAKFQQISTASILGRNTGGTGNVEELSAATTKTLLSLNNVENTALSTWAGSTNITTLGTIATGTWSGSTIGVLYGGTGQTSANAALNALLPSQGTHNGKFLQTDGSNTSWVAVTSGTVTDVSVVTANGVSGSVATSTTTPAITLTLGAITPSTVNGLTFASQAVGFTVAGGTTSKTLTVSNTLTLAGTDSSTLNIGSGGALGSAAFTASSAYEVPLTFSTGLTRSTNTITVNTTQNIAKLSNLTSNGFVKTSAGDGTLSVDTSTYLTGNQTITLSGDVSGSGTTAITTAIGTNVVTLAMMAQIATASILGRNTGGTGNVEVLSAATTKTLLSLNNVENTALSTWAGTSNITTIGAASTGALVVNGTITINSNSGSGGTRTVITSNSFSGRTSGSVNLSASSTANGGSIAMVGGSSTGSAGSLTTSAGSTGSGGSINTSGAGTVAGGSHLSYAGATSTNVGGVGGNVYTYGGDGSSGGVGGAGGAINTSGGAASSTHAGGAGGSISMIGSASSIGSPAAAAGSIRTDAYGTISGGNIYTYAGASASGPGGAAGHVYTYGGDTIGGSSGGAGGTISMYGGAGNGGGTATAGAAGSLSLFGGAAGSTSGNGAAGGTINTSGGSGGSSGVGGAGGTINTSGTSGSGVTAGFAGGSINTSGGASAAGGSITTSNGGGSIDTTGNGSIQFGTSANRITLQGTTSSNGKTQTLPNLTGTVIVAASTSTTNTQICMATSTAGGVAFATMSGDATIASGGALTIANNAVTLAKMATVSTARILGRVTGGSGNVEAMTGTQTTTLLDVFTSSLKGLAPASGGGTYTFLRADGNWASPPISVTSPGGTDYSVQYNTETSFGGDSNFTWDFNNGALLVKGVATTADVLTVQGSASHTGKLQFWKTNSSTVLQVLSTGVLESLISTGTAPFIVASTTKVTNLNADLLDGAEASSFSPVAGSTSIVTVGTITTGTWTGSAVGVSYGGTGQTSANAGLNALLPSQTGHNGKFLQSDGSNTSWVAVAGSGTVTDVSVVTANGISGSVATSTTTPAITLTLGAITPSTVNALTLASQAVGFTIAGGTASRTLTVSGNADVSGTNTGDQTITLTGGDVTTSAMTSGSYAATIAANAVTFAKFQQISTASILGRNTGGTGNVEELSAATTKTLLSLNNVENTALSTWTGSTNITTLGTIATGTWSGSTIAINKGGTGQTSPNDAFNALAPSQTGNSGKVLTTNGTNTSWAATSNVVAATVDFGSASSGEAYSASVTVTGQSWVTASSKIVCSLFAEATAEHDIDDYMLEQIQVYATNIVNGTGFDVVAVAPNGTFGRYVIHCIGV